MSQLNNHIKAAKSHWVAKRDAAHANLESLLSNPSQIANTQDMINEYLKDFSIAMNVLTTIDLIIESFNSLDVEGGSDEKNT